MSGSPLLCDPAEKARIEAANGVDQIDYISHLVNDLGTREMRESQILEFHRLAVKDIYPCAGKYRDAWRKVRIQGSHHIVPHEALVPNLVRDLVERVNATRVMEPAIRRAAYCLWRINWIHPFAGGNGRTARAAAYLILCFDMGMMLPGVPSMPYLIYQQRTEYVDALQAADAGAVDGGEPDLSQMTSLMEDVITKQLASAILKLSSTPEN